MIFNLELQDKKLESFPIEIHDVTIQDGFLTVWYKNKFSATYSLKEFETGGLFKATIKSEIN